MTPTPTPTFVCSICGEPSTAICEFCTKDACGNHICSKCRRCSDCCECELWSHRGRPSGQPMRKDRAENERHHVPGDQNGEQQIDAAQELELGLPPTVETQ